MYIIGILRVKDEADLLPDVLDNVSDGINEIYAYDDGSSDGTLEILQNHPKVTYIKTFDPSFTREVQKTRHLEDEVKKRHPNYSTEEVWVALLAGDLWWYTHSPRQAATEAAKKGYDCRNGVAVNFARWKWDEETDTWPNWTPSIQELCRWCKIIEELPVVWKVANYTGWHRLPWPRHFKKRWQGIDQKSVFLKHYGKRSPKRHQWIFQKGGRHLPKNTQAADWESFEFAYEHGKSLGYWENRECIPWEGPQTIQRLIDIENMSFAERDAVYASYDGNRCG
jgi:hypothetical protein